MIVSGECESKTQGNSIFQEELNNGIYLGAKNISYTIRNGIYVQKITHILNDINFVAEPGKVVAILGPSGSGKTSLLNILAGRIKSKGQRLIGGQIYINGKKVTNSELRSCSSFVMQNEVMLPYLTVQETLNLSAQLRLPNCTAHERHERINLIISDLGLSHCRNKIVGDNEVKSLSGGERRRVALAIELISDPYLLFIDEPTSGLDTFLSLQILQLLLKLAKSGRTIVCSVHQPRSQIFQSFNEILLLSKGKSIFYGSVKDCIDFFEMNNYTVPQNYNPSDYFLDLLVPKSAVDKHFPNTRNDFITYENLRILSKKFSSSEYSNKVLSNIDWQINSQLQLWKPLIFNKHTKGFFNNLLRPLYVISIIFKRTFINHSRNFLGSFTLNSCINIIAALIVGGIFFQLPIYGDSPIHAITNVYNIVGALFFILSFSSFNSLMCLESISKYRIIFNRERANGLYGTMEFIIAKELGDFIFYFIPPLFFSVIYFFMTGAGNVSYNNWTMVQQFFVYQVIIQCIIWTSIGISYFISSLTTSLELAQGIAPIIMVLMMVVSGFYLTTNRISVWISWFQYLSFVKFGYAALLLNSFPPNNQWGPLTTNEILYQLSISDTSIGTNIGIIIGLGFAYRFLAFIIFSNIYKSVGLE
ncbi:ABC-2 type transporter family protein [Cryptosporidium andersoni]|uniref:ABC-2 type transporter family protein n=1 Tax=Cryptosporidium andersoni TaxID=117008 RepID=A0A1J4MA94_9CRYT|nr:ABC-2 type transporter family protein [Cryptosporidium andersoni]